MIKDKMKICDYKKLFKIPQTRRLYAAINQLHIRTLDAIAMGLTHFLFYLSEFVDFHLVASSELLDAENNS